MAESAVLQLGIDTTSAEKGAKRASQILEKLGRSADKTGSQAAKGAKGVDRLGQSATMTAAQLKRADKAAYSAGRSFGNMIRIIGAGVSLTWAVSLLGQMQSVENQIKLVSTSTEDLNEKFAYVGKVAQQNSAPLGALAEVYSKINRLQTDLGISGDKVNKIFESIALGAKVSGRTQGELSGALMQLTQGLGNSILRAEEYNSVVQTMPDLVKAVATAMYGATGATAKLRAEVVAGTVTSKAFAEGLAKAAAQLQPLADKMSVTIPQAFTQLNNAILIWIQSSQTAGTAANMLAQAIQFVANNMNIIAPIVLTLAGVWATAFAYSTFIAPFVQLIALLPQVTAAFKVLTATLMANPFILIATLIAAAVAGLVYWITQTESGAAAFEAFSATVMGAWDAIKTAGASAIETLSGAWDGFIAIVKSTVSAIVGVVNAIIDGVNRAIAALKRLAAAGGGSSSSAGSSSASKMAGGGSINYMGRAAGGMGFTVPGNGNTDNFRAMVDLMPGEQLNVTPKKYAGPRDGGLTVRDIAEGVARGSFNIVAALGSVDNTISTGNTIVRKVEGMTTKTYQAASNITDAVNNPFFVKEQNVQVTPGNYWKALTTNVSRGADSTAPSLTGGNQAFGSNLFPDLYNKDMVNLAGYVGAGGISGGGGKYTFSASSETQALKGQAASLAGSIFGKEAEESIKKMPALIAKNLGLGGLLLEDQGEAFAYLIQQMKNFETRQKKDAFLVDYKAAFAEARGGMGEFNNGSAAYGTMYDKNGNQKNRDGSNFTAQDRQALAAARATMDAGIRDNNESLSINMTVQGVQDANSFRESSAQIENELASMVKNAQSRR